MGWEGLQPHLTPLPALMLELKEPGAEGASCTELQGQLSSTVGH